MKKVGKWLSALLLVTVVVGLFLIVVLGMFSDVIPFPWKQEFSRPPCEQLPDKPSVTEAFTQHKDLVNRIQNIGPGVKVRVSTPCKEYPDKALIRISFKTDTEKEEISAILAKEGFGTTLEMARD